MVTVQNKVVIVTGAGQGLGRAYAEALAGNKAKVVVAEINMNTGTEVMERIKADRGEAVFFPTDVTKYHTVERMVENAMKTYGRIDALVNNAAIFDGITPRPFHEISEEDWDREFEVNVKGTWNCCRAVLPHLLKQKKGKIINVSSSTAFEGPGMFLHYVATKGAILSMTRSMASEISLVANGSNITVNTLAPGAVFDEANLKIMGSFPGGVKEVEQRILGRQTTKRPGMVNDLVGPLLFLVSEASDFMNGSVICVDGGSSRH